MPKEKDEKQKTPEELLEERKLRGDFVEEIDDEEKEVLQAEEEVEPETEPEEEVKAEAEVEEPEVEEPEVEEPELQATEEEEEDEPGAKPDEPIMIPKSRFDEVQAKAREREEALQAQLDAAEAGKVKEKVSADVSELETELDTLDTQYSELLLEGEVEKATAVRREWRKKNEALFNIRLEQRSSQASHQAVESMRFDRQLAEYEVKYPAINPDSDSYDEAVAKEVAELMSAFEAKGENSVAALNKAVRYTPALRDQATDAPAAAPAPSVDTDALRSKRNVAARRKVAKVAKQSPPDITDAGRDTDKVGMGDGLPDVSKMTPEQFAEMSDAQLRKLRGDVLTDQEANS